MKRQFLIIMFLFQVIGIYCQNIETEKLWIGSYRINYYEVDSVLHSDTTNFFASILWFSHDQINIISFDTDIENCTNKIDTLSYYYRIEGNNIIGNMDDGFFFNGVIDRNVLKIKIGKKFTSVELTYLNPDTDKHVKNLTKEEIIKYLTKDKWEIQLNGNLVYEEFLPNNKFALSTWNREQRWDIYKVLDDYFLITNDCFLRPYLQMIENLSSDQIDILVFKNENIERIEMKRTKK